MHTKPKRTRNNSIIQTPKEQNEEIALDFVGPFQNAREGKKYLLVSIDHFPDGRTQIFCTVRQRKK